MLIYYIVCFQEGAGGGEGPPNKRPRDQSQPNKEKKPRKEFVGMTAEKKKVSYLIFCK